MLQITSVCPTLRNHLSHCPIPLRTPFGKTTYIAVIWSYLSKALMWRFHYISCAVGNKTKGLNLTRSFIHWLIIKREEGKSAEFPTTSLKFKGWNPKLQIWQFLSWTHHLSAARAWKWKWSNGVKKVKLTYFDAYLWQTMWNHAKKSMEESKLSDLVFLQWDVRSSVLKTPKNTKTRSPGDVICGRPQIMVTIHFGWHWR